MNPFRYYLTLHIARYMIGKGDKKRDAEKTIPAEVEVIRGEHYGGSKRKDHLLEMYRPKKRQGKLPVIVSIHGGAYCYGDIGVYRYYCADLAKRGYFSVNFNYPLAPKSKYPDILVFVNEVMEYLVQNASRFDLDLNNVFVLGDSAGAQMASQYGVIYSNPVYADLLGIHCPKEIRIPALGLNCGMYNLSPKSMIEDSKDAANMLIYYFPEDAAKRYGEKLEVLKYATKDYPPSYLVTFEKDFLKDSMEPMKAFLLSLGVEAEGKCYGDETTFHVHHVDVGKPFAEAANDDEIAFFARHIR